MDHGDISLDIQTHSLKVALDNRVKFNTPSEIECIECGNDIPERRRKVGGILRCIDCQTAHDAKNKHYR